MIYLKSAFPGSYLGKRQNLKFSRPFVGILGCLSLITPFISPWCHSGAIAADIEYLAQANPTTTSNRPTLRTGSRGVEVSELQAALKLLGYYTGLVNGLYGDTTAIAVSRFQQAAGLKSDGIVGATTWDRLFPSTTVAATPAAVTIPSPSPLITQIPSPTPTPNSAATFPIPSASPAAVPSSPAPRPTAPPLRPIIPSRITPQSRTTTTAASATTSNRQTTPRNSLATQTATNSPSKTVDFPILRLGMQGSAIATLQQRLRSLGFLTVRVNGIFDEPTQAAVQATQRRFRLQPDGVVGTATWNVLLR